MRATFCLLMANACVWMTTCSVPPNALELVQQTGELRVVTRNGPTTYYLGSEGPRGVEYELARGFADHLGVRLEIYTSDQLNDIADDLSTFRADIAAAGLAITPERASQMHFAPPYRQVQQQVIYRIGRRRPTAPGDLVGLRVAVLADSSFSQRLGELATQIPDLRFEAIATSDVNELLRRVVDDDIDVTVVDSNEFQIASQFYPELRVAFELASQDALAWALRFDDDRSLRIAVAEYFAMLRASGELAAIDERYYDNEHRLDYVGTRRFLRHVETRLPEFRATFERVGTEVGEDWRLLAAMGYQESHWEPDAVSPTGVRGLMMLTRATAGQLGIEDRTDAVQSIEGGGRYLAQIKQKIPPRIPEPDRTWMALAAYNVGFFHLEDARIITQRRGSNADDWNDVRESLPLLAQKKWYSQVRRGYARGWEPVRYVDNIRSYYDILIWATSEQYRARYAPPADTSLDPPADATPSL